MGIRKRISGRPKVDRNHLRIESQGGKFVIGDYFVVGQEDTVVMYYDGKRVGTYRDEKEAKAAQDEIRESANKH